MKKIICSALVVMVTAVNGQIVTMGGTFEGTVTGGQIHGKCKASERTCWSYNTDTKALTIYLNSVVHQFPNATEPVENPDGSWSATYE